MGKRISTAYWVDARNHWRIDVQKNGIRKSFYCSTPGRAGMRECHAKADAWLDEGLVDRRKKVKDMAELYMDDLMARTSQSHWEQYNNYLNNYIIPTIGKIAMEDLTEVHIQSVINKAHKKRLSRKYLSNIRGCMMNFLKFCRKAKVTTLICEDIMIPRDAAPSNKKILQPDDVRKLFSCNNSSHYGKPVEEQFVNAWRFAVVTGLRPGEILGLQWTDIFRETIHIQRSINVYGELTGGKNSNAQRQFELPSIALELLDNQRAFLDSKGINSIWIFPDIDGEPPSEDHYADRLKRYCTYNDIQAVTPYELRHTFVSISKAVDKFTLKAIVGHSADMDTFGIYGHAVNGDLTAAAQHIDKLFSDILDDEDKNVNAM